MAQQEVPRARYFILSFASAFFVLSLLFAVLVSAVHPGSAPRSARTGTTETAPRSSYQPSDQEALTVLFIGYGSDATDAGVFLLARFDPVRGSVPVVCLPAGTVVDTDAGPQTLAEAYRFGGIQYARGALEQSLEITVDRHVRMSAQVFVEVADTVGSVEWALDQEVRVGGGTLSPGTQLLDGKRAAQLISYREYEGGELGRCNQIGALAAGIVNQRIDVALSTLVDKVFEAVINRVDSDITYLDYELRKQAAAHLAGLEGPVGVAITVRGGWDEAGERFQLQDTCRALILQSFS